MHAIFLLKLNDSSVLPSIITRNTHFMEGKNSQLTGSGFTCVQRYSETR